MPDRNKVLVGAGVIWGMTLCCLLFSRKLRPTTLLNFIPAMLYRNQKMKNEDEQKHNTNDAGTSTNCDTNVDTTVQNEIQNRQPTPNFMMSGLTGASPPKFVSFDEIVKAANGMKNMALAHEIAVDKNFQLQKLEEDGSFHRRVKEIMHKAFWNLLAEQLAEDPPDYSQALVLMKEIKESLDELVPLHNAKIKENIREVLDLDLIGQQAEKGVLDFRRYGQYIISVMGKICAPVRDEKIKELSQQTDIVETFKGVMELLQLMRLDLANFTITMMRPNIIASSIEYEKGKFAEFLKINSNGLQYTERWLLRHFDPEKIAGSSSDGANTVRQITHSLLTEAYLDLLEWDFNPDAETLMLDQGRLLELRDITSRLSVVGSVILLVNNTIGAPIHGVSSLKKNIKEHLNALLDSVHSNKELEAAMPNIVLQVKTDVKTTLREVNAPELSPELETLLGGQIADLVDTKHKIRYLVGLRIRQFLQKIIQSQSTAPQQVPVGLSSLQEELAAIAARFVILVSHNRSVFCEYYQDIVANALAKSDVDNNKEIHGTQTMEL
ncbi:T-complex protein 11-like protein 1 isoform X1 [Temnothorax americanus]|uniref:T-complex protein 11-like protein 1 isoform X1 n=1 Tax=Temnothorax americanus TaxID=1964332 RepID=UPI004067F1F7